jgi:diadenosine tetraphosphatase ApaH/serine/threonine PP2A family protein phosphatase
VALYFTGPDTGSDGGVRGAQALDRTILDLGEGRWLVNPGSVGQPRDGDPRAAWLELDTDEWTATYHRVGYEIDRAAQAIIDAGLPTHLGERLYAGQ